MYIHDSLVYPILPYSPKLYKSFEAIKGNLTLLWVRLHDERDKKNVYRIHLSIQTLYHIDILYNTTYTYIIYKNCNNK